MDCVKVKDGYVQLGESNRDLVVFEVPIEKVKTLKFSLPAVHIAQEGRIRFTIPVGMVERK